MVADTETNLKEVVCGSVELIELAHNGIIFISFVGYLTTFAIKKGKAIPVTGRGGP
jgi:hypothetical protein